MDIASKNKMTYGLLYDLAKRKNIIYNKIKKYSEMKKDIYNIAYEDFYTEEIMNNVQEYMTNKDLLNSFLINKLFRPKKHVLAKRFFKFGINERRRKIYNIKNKPKYLVNIELTKDVTDEDISDLYDLEGIICNTKVTNNAFYQLHKIIHLDMNNNRNLDDDIINDYSDQLIRLKINDLVTDAGLKNLKKIQELSLNHNANISDEGIKNLSSLVYLHLGTCRSAFHCEEYGNKSLFSSILPNSLINKNITDVSLLNKPFLKYLYIGSVKNITDLGLSYLPHLNVLDISFSSKITDSSLSNLSQLRCLVYGYQCLHLTDISLNNKPLLEYLNTRSNVNISDYSLLPLHKLSFFIYNSKNKYITSSVFHNKYRLEKVLGYVPPSSLRGEEPLCFYLNYSYTLLTPTYNY